MGLKFTMRSVVMARLSPIDEGVEADPDMDWSEDVTEAEEEVVDYFNLD